MRSLGLLPQPQPDGLARLDRAATMITAAAAGTAAPNDSTRSWINIVTRYNWP